MRRGLSDAEWAELPLSDQEAVAWWRFVERYDHPMSDAQIAQLPIEKGVRAKAMAAQHRIREVLLPPDPSED